MLQKGIELERNEDLAGAVATYATVLPSDSVYEAVLLTRTGALINLERCEEVLPLCDEGIRMEGKFLTSFYNNKAVALEHLKRYDASLQCYDSAIHRFPGNFKLRYQRADLLETKGDLAAALAAMKDNAVRFPMQADAHIALAVVAQGEGRTSQAALSLFMALVVRWGDERSDATLAWLDQLLDGKLDHTPKGYDLGQGDDFSELDLLLANRVGMAPKYKAKPDLPYAAVRQGHFLLHALKDRSTTSGFWSTYYVPFFKDLVAQGKDEALLLHCLSSSSVEKVRANATKHKGEVEDFRNDMVAPFHARYATFPDTCNGAERPLLHAWNDDKNMLAVGEGDIQNEQQVGTWTFFHDKGAVSSRGDFDAQHLKTGTWKGYHENGRLARTSTWEAGKENGVLLTWHSNGAPHDSLGLTDGSASNGVYTEHWNTGRLKGRKTFRDRELTGPAWYYHANNALDYQVDLVKDVMNGPVKAYYPDGRIRFTAAFKDGERDGVCESFYTNGNKQDSYSYVNKLVDGPFKEWHPDGTLRAEGTCRKGMLVGVKRTWYANGAQESEEMFNDQGQLHGTGKNWTEEGQLSMESEYSRGMLIRYRFFDRTGKVIAENQRSKGKFDFVGYTADGDKFNEGSYRDEGAQEGAWKWYWPDGTLKTEEQMKNGKVDGTVRDYYRNGALHGEYRYLPGQERSGPFTERTVEGQVYAEGYLERGQLNGEYRRHTPDGKLEFRGYYADGELESWQEYYDGNGVLSFKERYQDGLLREVVRFDSTGTPYERVVLHAGEQTLTFHAPDGRRTSEFTYVNMVANGKATWYYPNGSKAREGQYLEGSDHGTWRTWHPNGQLEREWTLDMGKMSGVDRLYDLDGALVRENTYVDGMNTHMKNWHYNGKLSVDRPKANDVEHGTVLAYAPDGALEMVRYYRYGRLIGYSYAGPDGKPVDTIHVAQGVQKLRTFYANGKPSREMDLRNGEIDGTYREFHANGQLMEEAGYAAGRSTGVHTEYFPDGKVLSKGEWANGQQMGEHVAYWDNGQVRERCNWHNGDREGRRTLYDRTGKPTVWLIYRDDVVQHMQTR